MGTRTCSVTGRKITKGYVFNDGEYYVNDDTTEDRDKIAKQVYGSRWEDLSTCEDEDGEEQVDPSFYWTEFEDDDED